eukprot:GHVU01011796.1.p2 GENE.GHVU01011796.1~~GHVU01011796.1.p2  ORF type:complete len:121 (+),score=14.30 GHVU01011796.1:80-442(+)
MDGGMMMVDGWRDLSIDRVVGRREEGLRLRRRTEEPPSIHSNDNDNDNTYHRHSPIYLCVYLFTHSLHYYGSSVLLLRVGIDWGAAIDLPITGLRASMPSMLVVDPYSIIIIDHRSSMRH